MTKTELTLRSLVATLLLASVTSTVAIAAKRGKEKCVGTAKTSKKSAGRTSNPAQNKLIWFRTAGHFLRRAPIISHQKNFHQGFFATSGSFGLALTAGFGELAAKGTSVPLAI